MKAHSRCNKRRYAEVKRCDGGVEVWTSETLQACCGPGDVEAMWNC